ncbi:hypothetical protein [Anaplasma capra]|uniref:hypothetical protein n=1 Tax=Anaplasma capra TaxID=1562740 RepID=UPI0021D5C567|nr:hypothetical protein [Anaplasma capra]MCU7611506.1 hypothetical protein [Anaplasma capra]MCU7612055.1 hypothetical protein [Anaplasma capra]
MIKSLLKTVLIPVGVLSSLLLFFRPVRRCVASIFLWPFKQLFNLLRRVCLAVRDFLSKVCTIIKKALNALLSAVRSLISRLVSLFDFEAPEVPVEKSADDNGMDETLTDQEKYELEKEDKLLKKDVLSAKKYNAEGVGSRYESAAQIVGTAEPIGKWTRLVMSERQESLARLFSSGARLGDSDELPNGFWQMFVRLPSRFQGKYMARSR